MIEIILMLMGACIINIYLHELGRGGDNIRVQNFSITSSNKKYRYGGILLNFLTAYVIYYIKPELLFIQIIGLIAWKYTVYYLFLGLIKDKTPLIFKKYAVFNEITKKQAIFAIPLIILSFIIFKDYYYPILINIWGIVIGGL